MLKDDNKTNEKDNKKKILGVCCGIVILIGLIAMFTGGNTTHENTTEKEHIQITELDFERYGGVLMDTNLFGWIDAKFENGTNVTLYVTNTQMASLYYANNNSFQYKEGLLVTYHFDGKAGVKGANIVDHLYYPNGTEIPSVDSEKTDAFAANSLRVNDSLCSKYFGMTVDEADAYDSLK